MTIKIQLDFDSLAFIIWDVPCLAKANGNNPINVPKEKYNTIKMPSTNPRPPLNEFVKHCVYINSSKKHGANPANIPNR